MIDERAYAKAVGENVTYNNGVTTVGNTVPVNGTTVPVYGAKEYPAESYGVSPWSGKELGNTLEGEVERRRCRRDYGEYVRVANEGYYMAHVNRYVCDVVQAFLEAKTDKAMDILLLSQPPRHSKSFTITETLPSWFLGKNPTGNVIICGYEGTFAEGFSRRNRDKFNRYAKDVFRVEENPNIQGVAQWETAAGGRCRAAGLKGGITGFGAELFIIDDPIKNQEMAESETVLAKIHDEMGPSVQSRIHPGGKLIVIQTRWVENDVIGYIQSNWSDYVWADINLPCECEDEATDPLHRKLGDSLMGDHMGDFDLPQRIRNDNIWLRSKKMLVCAGEGERVWNALYQGHPSAQNGNLFRDNWWKRYCRRIGGETEDGGTYSRIDIADMEYTCLSVDATFKKTETSDRVAITLWGLSQKNAYLYKLINKRMGFTETVERIKRLCGEYPGIDQLIIEDKANGSAIIDTLKYTDGIPPIVAVNPLGGKYSRAQAVSPFIAGGSVYIPVDFTESERREIEDDNHIETGYGRFLYQMSHFPFAKNDDMVDSMSQALSRLIKIVTGEDPAPEKRWTRFVRWYPDMWEDFEQMNSMEQEEFIRTYGAPLEWEDD
nr:MAG TPA: Large Terminase [Caudoviricetes sp.]